MSSKSETSNDRGVNEGENAEENFRWLNDYTKCFVMNSDDIVILSEPNEFYQNLKNEFSNAKKRIVVSSLYLGSGNLEKELVNVIEKSLQDNVELKFKMLLDYSRYLRLADKSREYLEPVLKFYPDRSNLYLYHTPNLRGLAKKVIPERSNESLGVLHMKIYIADNNLIISGANLSNDYFTNRQDRYIVLKNCEKLCDYLEMLIDSISDFSFKVNNSNGSAEYLNKNPLLHPFLGNREQFKYSFSAKLKELIKSQAQNLSNDQLNYEDKTKAFVYPLIQNSDADISMDEEVTTRLFDEAQSSSSKISLAVGYFNLTANYIHSIVKKSLSQYEILVSSPEANGFFNSSGFSYNIPKFIHI